MRRLRQVCSPLVCLCLAIFLGSTALAPAQQGDKKKPAKKAARHEMMDYGPFLTATVRAPFPANNNAMKGIAIRLGKDGDAAVCFDSDLLRVSAGWTGDFLHLRGTPFDGGHGNWPEVKGKQAFGTKPMPGWGAEDNFKDPRPEPFGPLPHEQARFKGLYLHGDQVVLSYTVGGTKILELPGVEKHGGLTLFTRTFNVAPSPTELTLLVCDVEGAKTGPAQSPSRPSADRTEYVEGRNGTTAVGLINPPAGALWDVHADGGVRLKLAPSKEPVAFKLVLGVGVKADLDKLGSLSGQTKDSLDLAGLTKGGPPRWTEPVVTKGVLGKGDGPYVVDTLTVPDENPWNSWMRFGGMDFFKDGKRAALCTWSGDVWVVSGIDDKLENLTWKRFATGLFQPLGLTIRDDQVYVLGREGIVRLHDMNGDGEADFYEAFNNDLATTSGFHEFAFDLQTDPEGNFYFAKAGPVRGGGRGFEYIARHSGCILKVSKDGKKLEVFASGLRAPNGIGVGPHGEVTSGDNEGTWTPMCRLSLAKQGDFLGCVDTAHRKQPPADYDPPVCWFPRHIDNSSGGQVWVTSDKWGPFQGQLLHTSYGTSSLYLVLLEHVGGVVQGGVVRLPVNFLTGVMRPRFNPADGQLYVAGLRGWQTNAARDGAFQRVRYTGKPVHSLVGLHVTKTGLDLTFTDPLDAAPANDAGNWVGKEWNYLWCSEYGSAHYTADPEFHKKTLEYNRLREEKKGKEAAELAKQFKKGETPVTIKSARLSEDRKTVSLEIPELRPVMQMNVRARLRAADGTPINLDLYNTVNKVP